MARVPGVRPTDESQEEEYDKDHVPREEDQTEPIIDWLAELQGGLRWMCCREGRDSLDFELSVEVDDPIVVDANESG